MGARAPPVMKKNPNRLQINGKNKKYWQNVS